jgi:spermidine synthase
VQPWVKVAETRTEAGGTLALVRRGDEWEVLADGLVLMSSRTHASETALARLALRAQPAARSVLVGGLGLGFTLRAALDGLPKDGTVTLAELSPALVEWNRTHVALLAGRPLDDPRVRLRLGDVCTAIRQASAAYDAILLDVDNGPVAFANGTNGWLYGDAGTHAALVALRPGGVLAVWSAGHDEAYLRRLRRHGFAAAAETVRAHGRGGQRHVVFIARKP